MEIIPGQEQLPEIRAYFFVNSIPDGEAPYQVRAQWVGLVLPIRHDLTPESPRRVPVRGVLSGTPDILDHGIDVFVPDCIEVLNNANRREAAEYWENMYRLGLTPHALVFDTHWGMVVTPEAKVRFFPD